jgi:uncharacterized protein (TIGR03067 family)
VSRTPVPLLAFALFVPSVESAPKPKDAPKTAPANLIGQWKAESSRRKIAPLPPGDLTVTLTADGKTEGRIGGKTTSAWTFTCDPKKDPAEIDLTREAPLGVPLPGIYKLDGDTLTVCVSTGRRQRPTSFDPTEGPGVMRTVYKRVTAKD